MRSRLSVMVHELALDLQRINNAIRKAASAGQYC